MSKLSIRLLFPILLLSVVLALGGCESLSENRSQGAHSNTEQTNTSTIPWNKPQSWEGPGAYGSMMPGSR